MIFRIPARAMLGFSLIILLVASSIWSARAQQAPADASNFTGKSESLDTKGVSVTRRSFERAARSNWHVHVSGQLLFVQEGSMRVQVEGQPMRELRKGDSTFLPAKVAHWHGAIPAEALQQVSVTFAAGNTWMEPVTDAQYEGKAGRK